jgi:hypothetical protein
VLLATGIALGGAKWAQEKRNQKGWSGIMDC